MSKDKKDEKKKEKPISLAGPDFKELMRAFLKVDPKDVEMKNDPCKKERAAYEAAQKALAKAEEQLPNSGLPRRNPGEHFKKSAPQELSNEMLKATSEETAAKIALEDCEKKHAKD